MAVIQISKMQVRRGQTALTGFPQLSSGELGWSIDTQELYIGNGAVSEGSPAIGNTQIITEHNVANFFLTAPTGYKYKNNAYARYRTIQDKLDDDLNINDIVDITSSTLHTEKIQDAIDLVSINSPGKPLVFPEGEYIVTGTIYIPAYMEIRGAGSQKTKIVNLTTGSTFQTIDGAGYTFDNGGGSYGENLAPRNIKISGITFINSTTNARPLLQLDAIADSAIENCEFIGDLSSDYGSTSLVSGIDFRDMASFPAQLTDNVLIKNCTFWNLNSGITSDYDIANIIISENKFYKLDSGVVFGKTITGIEPQKYGPQHVKISHNRFDTINKQAVYAGSTSTNYFTDINSENNFYRNVGCNGLGDGSWTQVYEVLYFGAPGNYSINDTFDRLDQMNTGTMFLSPLSTATAKAIIAGPATFKSKGTSYYSVTSSDKRPLVVFPRSMYQYGTYTTVGQTITLEYTVTKPALSLIRRGTVSVVVNGTATTVSDSYSTNNDTELFNIVASQAGTVFTADVSSSRNIVTIYQENQSTGTGYISYTYTVRQ